jgi:hypothetical protein
VARTLLRHLVGHDEELDLLRRRWKRARNGAGQLTRIVREPALAADEKPSSFSCFPRLRAGKDSGRLREGKPASEIWREA